MKRIWLAALLPGLIGLGPLPAGAQSPGLMVVIANDYDDFLDNAVRDANAIADKAEETGFASIRLLSQAGSEIAGRLDEIRAAAQGAGSLRIVYASGFGMCTEDDLVLFAEDMQPEQFQSGEIGDVATPLSVIAEAAATGGGQVLVVFDTNPNRCTEASLRAVELPENSALLVTTGIGGDVLDEIEEGRGAFVSAFLSEFSADRMPPEMLEKIVEQISTLTDEQQVPVLIGGL